jgi:serine/threonine protein kinase
MMQQYSTKSDVWSYGCCLYEIITGHQPHHDKQDLLQLAVAIRDHGVHPEIPEETPALLKPVLEACWRFDPDQRPSFKQILGMLNANKTVDEAPETGLNTNRGYTSSGNTVSPGPSAQPWTTTGNTSSGGTYPGMSDQSYNPV